MRGEDRTIHPPDATQSLAAANGSAVRSWPTGGPGILAEYNAPCLTSQSNGSNGLPYMVGTEVWTLFDCASFLLSDTRTSHAAYHGMVRGVVRVTENSASPSWVRSRLLHIDAEAAAVRTN